ncbi:BQ5605_C032g11111 [Microbotryum silenes-dioicae]|uniref:BQ5605_C032g11111 protein n=1 Tax=Microbotryum silenes-dioicae TaxID=796604 RepID=A0A2X0MK46_9BASI|nr:BQ5605_C032g11111 [Microbotryum silenes-dioicae]
MVSAMTFIRRVKAYGDCTKIGVIPGGNLRMSYSEPECDWTRGASDGILLLKKGPSVSG